MIRYKNPNSVDSKLHIISENAVEPATEEEEYNGLMHPSTID
jgi:dynein heavy chain, axonemal